MKGASVIFAVVVFGRHTVRVALINEGLIDPSYENIDSP